MLYDDVQKDCSYLNVHLNRIIFSPQKFQKTSRYFNPCHKRDGGEAVRVFSPGMPNAHLELNQRSFIHGSATITGFKEMPRKAQDLEPTQFLISYLLKFMSLLK